MAILEPQSLGEPLKTAGLRTERREASGASQKPDPGAWLSQKQDRMREAERGTKVSIASYIFMSSLKLLVGYLANSKALMADGLNNTTDIAASLAVFIGLRIAGKPADHDHRYGHARAETVATFVAACIMTAVGLDVLQDAVMAVIRGRHDAPGVISMWTSLFAAFFMFGVSVYNYRIGRKVQSQAVLAAAADNRSDAVVSLGAFVGILGSRCGAYWLDPFAAVVVGLVILKTAYDILRDSTHTLTDGCDAGHVESLKAVANGAEGVVAVKDIRVRNSGSGFYIDLVVGVNPQLSVVQGHEIADRLEALLAGENQVERVHVHVEPA